ncbi:MAG: DUF58 domain-containing protein [Gammaproteobacteria bacterium]|nr:DUF58 domain-containing protein [Gammaproteobacteria bacterium]
MSPSGLPLLPDFAARLLEKWASRRIQHRGNETELDNRQLYILPTRHGMVFFIVLMINLVAAINYEISLGFMLVFLLAAIGFLSIIYTHINLNHLKASISNARAVFAGQDAEFPISLNSLKHKNHFSVILQNSNGKKISLDIRNDSNNIALLPIKTSQRGKLAINRFKIYSEYPLGLFHVWSWLELDAHCIVYPHPLSFNYRQHGSDSLAGSKATNESGYDDFSGIRKYQEGDPPNHLAWKAIARTGSLQTKHYSAEKNPDIVLSWYNLPDKMDTETRLSILCYQVIQNDAGGNRYGLVLPGLSIHPASGLHHRHQCLLALATFGSSGND